MGKKELGCIRGLEAGFFSSFSVRTSFSIQFVFLMVLFVFFDCEFLFVFSLMGVGAGSVLFGFVVVFFLLLGFFLELKWGKFVWLK